MAKPKKRIPLNDKIPGAFNNPFATLGSLSVPSQAAPAATPEPLKTSQELGSQPKLTVRHERKGRGGKTVTLITGLQLAAGPLDALCRALKRQLGCGATVEEGVIVLQGALGERVVAALKARGAKTMSQSGW